MVVEEDLKVVYKSVNIDIKGFDRLFPIIKGSEGRVERKILPLNVNDGVGVDSRRRDMHNGRGDLKEGRGYEDDSKERVTVSLAE